MFRRFRPRSIYDVCAALALFIALGGTAYAVNTVGSADIVDESILSQDIQNQQVKVNDLAIDSVWGSRLKDGGIFAGKLADDSVNKNNVVNDSLTASDINEQAASLVRGYARINPLTNPCIAGPGNNECPMPTAKGITKVTQDGSFYCVTAPGIDADKIPAAVSVEWLGSTVPTDAQVSVGPASQAGTLCPNDDTDYLVVTEKRGTVDVGNTTNDGSVTVASIANNSTSVPFQIVIP